VLVHNNSKNYTRQEKRELIKGEYATNYTFFMENHISRLLWGKCLVFEGIEQSGWCPHKNDLIVTTETYLSRKEIHRLNIIANLIGKELFVLFNWGPKGLGSIIITVIIETFTKEIIRNLLKKLFEEKKCFKVKQICIKNINNKQYLEIIDNNDNIYEFIINGKIDDLEEKVFSTIDSLKILYSYEEIDKAKYTYDRYGSKIDYDIKGKIINIKT
jgi:hypothetical protein